MRRTVLVPVDGSDHSLRALSHALQYNEGDEVVVLHVVNSLVGEYGKETPGGTERKQSEAVIETVEDRFENAALEDTPYDVVVKEGTPQDVIVSYAEETDVDQIVMGTRGLAGIKRMLLGSVADGVIRRSSVPVNVVPSDGED
jgi:nucleotide-binding universal stress UspA family protein